MQLLLDSLEVPIVVFNISLKHGHLAVQLLVDAGEHIHLHPNRFQVCVTLAQCLTQIFCPAVQGIQVVMGLLQDEGGGNVVFLGFLGGGGEALQGVQPHGYLHAFELVFQLQVFFGFFGLGLQGFQLQLQLRDLVSDAEQVFLGALQLPLGVFFSVAVFGNTGGFFKNFPAVAAFQGQNFVNAALADVGVAFPAQTRVHQQFVDVPQSGRLFVDIVFAVSRAVIAPGDHNLVGIIGKGPVPVVQGKRCLSEAHGSALLRAAENDVLHFCAPKGLGALLAHDPENGVGNVGLT